MKRYHHAPNSNDVRMPVDGARLFNVQPMGEEFYDKDETGPMFTAEAEGFDGVLHLFEDEIVDDGNMQNYLVCTNCGEAFDNIDSANDHELSPDCPDEANYSIKPESEVLPHGHVYPSPRS